ncbi:EAL domain-containing response regulator [Vibrio furnissii]|uniref:EAL domain-containing response regulator n=1 Tax=Vibrio furnissii TaxID=29494 RepID=UPI003D7D7861
MNIDSASQLVLVVDDCQLHCGVLKVVISQLGVTQIHVTHNGRDALALCKKFNFDLIICDLEMPEMDGLALLSELAERQYTGRLCLLSGHDENILKLAAMMCQQLGLDLVASLPKPVTSECLKSVLQTVGSPNTEKYCAKTLPSLFVDDLDEAFELGHLRNVYQPQCRFKNGVAGGYEALIRWYHPEYGVLTPYLLLPLIEQANWHNRLFFYVLQQALNDFSKAKFLGTVSVNATHTNFADPQFAKRVLECCRERGFNPSRLIIELTEMEVYQYDSVMVENFARLRLNGVELAIDDFGAGYSSLLKLADLPFTEMKIDRALIVSSHKDTRKRAILNVIVRMAKQLNMRLVAEGVEDSDTWRFLNLLGIDLCQGYYTGKPRPIEHFNGSELSHV